MNPRLTANEIRDSLALYGDLPYHGRHHPMHVALTANGLIRVSQTVCDVTVVEAACLLHDAGYVPGADDNEERAAEHASRVLANRPSEMVEQVRQIIMDTKHHDPDLAHIESVIVCDADMLGFAVPWEEFLALNDDIEREYLDSGIDKTAFDAGRLAFLRGALEAASSGSLFHLGWRHGDRHHSAASNLRRLIALRTA